MGVERDDDGREVPVTLDLASRYGAGRDVIATILMASKQPGRPSRNAGSTETNALVALKRSASTARTTTTS